MSRGFVRFDSQGTLLDDDSSGKTKTKSKRKTSTKSNNHYTSGAYADIQPQNVKSSRVYVFGEAEVDEEEVLFDTSMEMSELRPRGAAAGRQPQNNNSREKEDVLDREIVEGDTLQSIALQYGCQVLK